MNFHALRMWTAGGLLALGLVLPGCGNGNDSQPLAPLDFVPSTHQECLGSTNCASEQADTVTIDGGDRKSFTFTCSQANPYLQNWDAAQHREISLGAVSFTSGSVTLMAKNAGSKPGSFTVTLGCSTQPSTSADFMSSKGYKWNGQ